MASQKTRSGIVSIGSYGVVSNETESEPVGARLYGFSPQSPMESWTAARKMGTPGQLPDDPIGRSWTPGRKVEVDWGEMRLRFPSYMVERGKGLVGSEWLQERKNRGGGKGKCKVWCLAWVNECTRRMTREWTYVTRMKLREGRGEIVTACKCVVYTLSIEWSAVEQKKKILPRARMFFWCVFVACYAGNCLCGWLIAFQRTATACTCLILCELEALTKRRPRPEFGCCATQGHDIWQTWIKKIRIK
jgi:hypothetical protein